MLKKDQYRVRNAKDDMGEKTFNPIFFDIDARLHSLELQRVSYLDAITELQNFGLERINGALQPTIDQIKTILEGIDTEHTALLESVEVARDGLVASNAEEVEAFDVWKTSYVNDFNQWKTGFIADGTTRVDDLVAQVEAVIAEVEVGGLPDFETTKTSDFIIEFTKQYVVDVSGGSVIGTITSAPIGNEWFRFKVIGTEGGNIFSLVSDKTILGDSGSFGVNQQFSGSMQYNAEASDWLLVDGIGATQFLLDIFGGTNVGITTLWEDLDGAGNGEAISWVGIGNLSQFDAILIEAESGGGTIAIGTGSVLVTPATMLRQRAHVSNITSTGTATTQIHIRCVNTTETSTEVATSSTTFSGVITGIYGIKFS